MTKPDTSIRHHFKDTVVCSGCELADAAILRLEKELNAALDEVAYWKEQYNAIRMEF